MDQDGPSITKLPKRGKSPCLENGPRLSIRASKELVPSHPSASVPRSWVRAGPNRKEIYTMASCNRLIHTQREIYIYNIYVYSI